MDPIDRAIKGFYCILQIEFENDTLKISAPLS